MIVKEAVKRCVNPYKINTFKNYEKKCNRVLVGI